MSALGPALDGSALPPAQAGRLRVLNVAVGLAHLGQAAVMLALSNDLALPATAAILPGDPISARGASPGSVVRGADRSGRSRISAAGRLIDEPAVDEVTVELVSRIGAPVTEPHATHVSVAGHVTQARVSESVEHCLHDREGVRDRLLAGRYELF